VEPDADFTAYMTARWSAFVRMAVLLGCSQHDAEDVAQMAFQRCHRSWGRVSGAEDRDAYAYRVLVNAHKDSLRRRWRRERPTGRLPEAVTPDTASDVARRDAVDRALAELPAGHREVLVLRFYAGLTEAQTATALGVPVGTVKSRHSRALKHLAASTHLRDTDGSRP
jgi:RNA polymerase sigma-70 factor (sigma-E family)